MPTIYDLIGKRFEKFFSRNFSGFVDLTGNGCGPDFYNPEYKFWVETKAGNQRWGPRIKRDQLANHKNLDGNAVYVLGYHNFNDARERLSGRPISLQKRLLRGNLEFSGVVFVNSEVMQSVWDKDFRVSKKDKTEYLMFKDSVVRNITLDRPFERWGVKIPSASGYYGFSTTDFLLIEPKFDARDYGIGTILHKERDRNVIGYLQEEGRILVN